MNRLALAFVTALFICIAAYGQQPEKIHYDKDWKATKTLSNATYYRIISLDSRGRPIGVVRDYYISGELQWEGTLSYFDRDDDEKNIQQGKCSWFFKNGKKMAEATYVDGKLNGVRKEWYESGRIKEEAEFLNNKPNGQWITYYENGKLESKYIFGEGKLVGKWFTKCDEFEKCQKVFLEDFKTKDNEFGWTLSNNSNVVPELGLVVRGDKSKSSAQWVHLPIDIRSDFSIETIIKFGGGVPFLVESCGGGGFIRV